MRHVSCAERRARIAVRHALAPAHRADSPEAATAAMTVLHGTEPATVYLSCRARTRTFVTSDLDRALSTDRTLVKQLAMRRTLFVFPRELLPAVWPSASARVAATERARIAKDAGDPAWLDEMRAGVLAFLAGTPEGRSAAEIRQAVPMGVLTPRVLGHLGATADLVRGANTSRWYVSRPRWTLMRDWLGEAPAWWTAAGGYREIVRRWLRTFGPGTEADIVWWLGSTKAVVRAALAELDAEPVSLDGGGTGWVLPGDADSTPDPGPWVALLPVLDPTTMGWKERDFYLGPHAAQLFDRTGNAGTTAWVDGRVVGCWVQDAAGRVEVRLVSEVSAAARRALDAEAHRLTDWLDGLRIGAIFPSPAMKPRS